MLYEIICDKFNQTKITFHEGLNVVLGDGQGTNSIGKSTLLMIIDFVFGGNDYLLKSSDVQKHIGQHNIYFSFIFGNKKFCFLRNTSNSETVGVCNEKYEEISKKSLTEYTKWLMEKYDINLYDLSFRDMVGRYFRIYGKENLNEKRPLDVVSKEPSSKSINALIKIMNLYSPILTYEKEYKEKKLEFDTFKQAQDFDFIPKKLTTKEKKETKEKIEKIKKEQELIEEESDKGVLDIETEKIDTIVSLRRDLSIARRQQTLYKTRLAFLNETTIDNIESTKYHLFTLSKYFPSINIREIDEVQLFHKNLKKVLKQEIDKEQKSLLNNLDMINTHIDFLLSTINEIDTNPTISSVVLKKYARTQVILNKLIDQQKFSENYSVLEKEKKEANEKFQIIQGEKIEELKNMLNKKMNEINDFIYDGQKEAPSFTFSGSDYSFFTINDTGTGTSFISLIIFDLSILQMTVLPVLIHDSCLLKQIADQSLLKLLELYQDAKKQVFIALDKISSYPQECQLILEKCKVIELSNHRHELFGFSWSNK